MTNQQKTPSISVTYTEEELKQQATNEIAVINDMEIELVQLENALTGNPQFVQFLEFQKKLNLKTAEFWDAIKKKMIDSKVKSIKGDWGWITIGETKSVVVIDEEKLPKKFFKRQVDMQMLKDNVKLTNKLPAGTEEKIIYSLRKDIKTRKMEG